MKWAKGTLKPSVESRFVLFVDNLEGQIAEEFKKLMLVVSVGMGYQEQQTSGNLLMQDMQNY